MTVPLALFLEFLFLGGSKPGRWPQGFAIIVERQIAHVKRQRAGRRLLVDDHRDRTAFDAVAERDPAAAGQARVCEALQHPAAIISRGSEEFFDCLLYTSDAADER